MKTENTQPYISPGVRMSELETVKAETFIQRIARNVAWYALRIARPEYFSEGFTGSMMHVVAIKNREKVATFMHYAELQQGCEERFGDRPPVPLENYIFRG